MTKQFLTAQETSLYFFNGKVFTALIYRLAAKRDLPSIRVGKRLLINLDQLKVKYA